MVMKLGWLNTPMLDIRRVKWWLLTLTGIKFLVLLLIVMLPPKIGEKVLIKIGDYSLWFAE